MKGPRKPAGDDARGEIDLKLGNLLGELGTALSEMIGRLEQGSTGEILRDREFTTDRGPVRAQAGIRIRLAGTEAPRRRSAGAPRPEAAAPASRPAPGSAPGQGPAPGPEPRPIQAEVVDDGRTWRLTAELPGAARDDLELAVEDGDLVITALTRTRSFADRVALPAATMLADLRVSLQNGILEIETASGEGRTP
jgi:HSP20 family molecular chaperone IbpA